MTDREGEGLLPCPFCGGAVMEREALWPCDGDTDSIIHAKPTDCGLYDFSISKADKMVSTIAAWNTRASGWQPIESAPKDGTWFLICRAGEEDSVEVGRYRPFFMPEFVEVEDGLYRKESKSVFDWDGFNNIHRATHWQPLEPLPPAPQGEG